MTMKINPVILCTQYSNVKSAVCLSSGTIFFRCKQIFSLGSRRTVLL